MVNAAGMPTRISNCVSNETPFVMMASPTPNTITTTTAKMPTKMPNVSITRIK